MCKELIALQSKKKMSDAEFAEYLGVPKNTLRNWKCEPGDVNHRPMPQVVQRFVKVLVGLEILVPGFYDSFIETEKERVTK